jgi:hypothetical protein
MTEHDKSKDSRFRPVFIAHRKHVHESPVSETIDWNRDGHEDDVVDIEGKTRSYLQKTAACWTLAPKILPPQKSFPSVPAYGPSTCHQ